MDVAHHGILLVGAAPSARAGFRGEPIPALQSVANRPIICHALQAMHDAAVADVAVAVPTSAAESVKACIDTEFPHAGVSYVTYDTPGQTGTALRVAAEQMDNAPCLVHVADGLLAQPLVPFTRPRNHDATDMLLLVHRGAPRAEQLGATARRLLGIAEFGPTLGVAGVCLFGLGALRRACARAELVGGQGDFIAMADGLATAGGRMEAQFVRGWRRYSGEVDELLDLNRAALDLLVTEFDHRHDDGTNRIEGRISIDPTAEISSSVVVGPVMIGPGARLSHAYVGPYTSIGAGASIEGAEIEQSIVAAEASIRHVAGRLASSVIGRRARIHRDFSIPRALRLRVGEDVEVALP